MSTATISATPNVALFQRFVWKEYRMLRGFWLAVGGLGVLMQLATTHMMFKATEIPGSLLLVAWGAAALYAIGAAVTLFSAESEEQTRDFLLILPGRWLPMFAAKVTMALVSAFCLGLALCATGGWVNDGTWLRLPLSRERWGDVCWLGCFGKPVANLGKRCSPQSPLRFS